MYNQENGCVLLPFKMHDYRSTKRQLQITHDSFLISNIENDLEIESGPMVIKLFSYSTQLSTKFILLINVKMPTIVGILTFISMIDTTSERLKAENFFSCRYFSFYDQLKFRAQLS